MAVAESKPLGLDGLALLEFASPDSVLMANWLRANGRALNEPIELDQIRRGAIKVDA